MGHRHRRGGGGWQHCTPGHYETSTTQGHYETRQEWVWVAYQRPLPPPPPQRPGWNGQYRYSGAQVMLAPLAGRVSLSF
jgi:hypothetical protein